jgi:hypothetical protein
MMAASWKTLVLTAAFMPLIAAKPVAAAERVTMPIGALMCKAIDPAIEHAKLVGSPRPLAFVRSLRHVSGM